MHIKKLDMECYNISVLQSLTSTSSDSLKANISKKSLGTIKNSILYLKNSGFSPKVNHLRILISLLSKQYKNDNDHGIKF